MHRMVKVGGMKRLDKQLKVYIHIPGGWEVPVGLHWAEPEWESLFQTFYGGGNTSPREAKVKAMVTIQRYCEHGYVRGLKEAVMRRACEYARKWPHLRNRVGWYRNKPLIELDGFDPVRVQEMYVPFEADAGRGGSLYAKKLMSDMAHLCDRKEDGDE